MPAHAPARAHARPSTGTTHAFLSPSPPPRPHQPAPRAAGPKTVALVPESLSQPKQEWGSLLQPDHPLTLHCSPEPQVHLRAPGPVQTRAPRARAGGGAVGASPGEAGPPRAARGPPGEAQASDTGEGGPEEPGHSRRGPGQAPPEGRPLGGACGGKGRSRKGPAPRAPPGFHLSFSAPGPLQATVPHPPPLLLVLQDFDEANPSCDSQGEPPASFSCSRPSSHPCEASWLPEVRRRAFLVPGPHPADPGTQASASKCQA